MVNRLHVISGLPRSGSTLLSAILRQNPRFHASVTSPLLNLCSGTLEKMGPNTEFQAFFDDDRRRRILKGIVSAYYSEVPANGIVFDTNRHWTARIPLLASIYPDARLICCVREVGWIIDSIERMLRRNPLQHSRVFGYKPGSSTYGRVETLMNSESGLIGQAWSSLREAWFSHDANRLIVMRYESLTSDPRGTLVKLYDQLGEPLYPHDFDHINFDAKAYDADLGMPGLHTVMPSVRPNYRKPCIPPDLFTKHGALSFWNKPESNLHGVIVL